MILQGGMHIGGQSLGVRFATLVSVMILAGCASGPAGRSQQKTPDPASRLMREKVVPDGVFREHILARCQETETVPPVVERYLGTCSEYFRQGSGSDGMIELEIGLKEGHRHPLMLLTLGQLYLLAGQGDPDLLPVEGPAADVGDYARNKPRLLGRARQLLAEAETRRPDDAAVDYLLADVARAMGETARADSLVDVGEHKCTGGRSFRILKMYQGLFQHPPRYLGGPSPDFPQSAVDMGVDGDVVLDLLLSPAGDVKQYEVVASPSEALTRAAWQSMRQGRFQAASVGKYAVWSWLRVTTSFNLSS